jgi:hypothetical protein
MILSGSVENTYPFGHGGGGGGSEVASAGDIGVGLALGGDDGGGEERKLGAGAGEVSGPGGVGGEEVVLGAGAGADSRDPTDCNASSWRRSTKQSDCSEIGEAVGVGLGGGDRAGGGIRRRGGT